jgi:hypothetical protein
MKLTMVDYKGNEMLNVKVEVNEYLFVVAPEIVNENFNYLKPRLMNVRADYMQLFLENTGLQEKYEYLVYKSMKEVLEKEIKNIYENEGVMFYLK